MNKRVDPAVIKEIADSIDETVDAPEAPPAPAPTKPLPTKPGPSVPKKPQKPGAPWKKPFQVPKPKVDPAPKNCSM
jgi:hypothetical protein